METPLIKGWTHAKLCDSVGKLCYVDEFGYFYLVGLSVSFLFEGNKIYLKDGDKYKPNGTGTYVSYDVRSSDDVDDIMSAIGDFYVGSERVSGSLVASNIHESNNVLDVTGNAKIREFVVEVRIQDCKLKLKRNNGLETYHEYDTRITAEYNKIQYSTPTGFNLFLKRTMTLNSRTYNGTVSPVGLQDTDVSSSGIKYVTQSRIAGDRKDDVLSFFNREISVCGCTENEWMKIASPFLPDLSVGDAIYLSGVGAGEIINLYDRHDKCFLTLRLQSGEVKDVNIGVSIWYLPYGEKGVKNELEEINHSYMEQLLSPYVVGEEGTFNVFWYTVPDAASYHVAVYRTIERKNMPCVIKMRDFEIDRNTGYFAIDKLVGNGFIFKVYAENRDGKIISESRGILDGGEPVTLMRKK